MSVTIQLDVITPERETFSEEVSDVVVPGTDGEFAALPGHAPMIALVSPGILLVGGDRKIVVDSGYAEVQPDRVAVLVDQAVEPADVDVEATKADLKLYGDRLKELAEEHPDYHRFHDHVDFCKLCLEVAKNK